LKRLNGVSASFPYPPPVTVALVRVLKGQPLPNRPSSNRFCIVYYPAFRGVTGGPATVAGSPWVSPPLVARPLASLRHDCPGVCTFCAFLFIFSAQGNGYKKFNKARRKAGAKVLLFILALSKASRTAHQKGASLSCFSTRRREQPEFQDDDFCFRDRIIRTTRTHQLDGLAHSPTHRTGWILGRRSEAGALDGLLEREGKERPKQGRNQIVIIGTSIFGGVQGQ
jgi:hypothetical protein